MARVVLAYTGGLATSLCIHWLRFKKGMEVVTFTANVGQKVNLEPIGERAIELGAEVAHVGDLRERYVKDFAFNALRADAVYESGYYLGTALTRPLIISEMVKIAQEDRCDYLAHGCSGRGNDRVRFETAAKALAPHLKVLAPLEEWGLTTREDQVRYAERYGMEGVASRLAATPDDAFATVEQNVWGIARAHDASLLDPWQPVPKEAWRLTASPDDAPPEPADLRIGWKRGVPTRLDGKPLRPIDLVEALNELGGRYGVGRLDVMEDRISGLKTRELYEAPAAAILYEAHRALESLVLPKDLLQFKGALSRKYADLVYAGAWFGDLRESLDAFFRRTQEKVTGDVRVRLRKARATVRGVRSPFSLYDPSAGLLEAEPCEPAASAASAASPATGAAPVAPCPRKRPTADAVHYARKSEAASRPGPGPGPGRRTDA